MKNEKINNEKINNVHMPAHKGYLNVCPKCGAKGLSYDCPDSPYNGGVDLADGVVVYAAECPRCGHAMTQVWRHHKSVEDYTAITRTAGYWSVEDSREDPSTLFDYIITDSSGACVAYVENCNVEEEEANAYLLAQAPRMLEVLYELYVTDSISDDKVDKVREVLEMIGG